MACAWGGASEITTAALAEASALAPLAEVAEVVAVFYGTKQFPIAPLLAQLAPGVRARGAHFIAVLQRDQFALRDACFQAGASDLLFMPMPKEQFVARLHEAGSLACAEESGLGAQVTLVTRERGNRCSRRR